MLLEPVERGVGRRRGASASALTSSASTLAGAAGQVQGEGAVVGEAVEGSAARRRPARRPAAGWDAGRGRLRSSARPRARPGSGRRPRGPRSRGAPSPRASSTPSPRPSRRRTGRVVPEQDPLGVGARRRSASRIASRMVSSPAERSCTDQPAVVAVDHQRREPVAFAVHQAVGGGIDAAPARGARREALAPPGGVHRAVGPLEQPQPDLRARGSAAPAR